MKKNNSYNRNHESVMAAIFRTTPFFDSRDIVQVKYEMVRAASNAEGTISEISSAHGFSRKSYYEINQAFMSGGLCALVPKKPGPKKPHKLTDEAIAYIDLFLADKPNAKSSEISVALETEMGVSVGYTLSRENKKKRIIITDAKMLRFIPDN